MLIDEIEEIKASEQVADLLIRIKSLEEQNKNLRQQIVYGFYEDEYPIYTQGIAGEHEMTSPITADEANGLVEKIRQMQSLVKRLSSREVL